MIAKQLLAKATSGYSSASRLGENLLDFIIHRESAHFTFRKDYLAINHHVELASFARLYLDLLTEAGC
jgi:hypothetical protein